MKLINRAAAFLTTALLFTPLAASATNPIPGGTAPAAQPLTLSKVVQLVTYAINVALGLALTVVIAMIVYNGFRMATSRGNDKVFAEAKTGLWYAIIGLTVVLGVGLIVATIGGFARNPASVVR